jgi:Fe2+ transport system protein FeoA
MDRAAVLVTGDFPLTVAAPGTNVVVARFVPGITAQQLEQLMSYGLEEGRTIHVLRQQPVTVLLIDHTELALEDEVARAIHVLEVDQPPPS